MLDEDGPPRSRRELLRTPVGAIAIGRILSTLAVWMTGVAGAILVYELTGSAVIVGLTSVAQFTPQLVLTPWTGARADHSDRFLQVIVGTAITGLGSVLLVAWAVGLGFSTQRDAWVMVAASGLVGTGYAVNGPASSALIPALVRRSELADALALSTLPIIIARSAGPAIGATLYLVLGPAITFGVATLLHLAFLVALVRLSRRVTLAPRTSAEGTDRRIRAGLVYLRRSPRTVLLMLGVGIIGVGADPVTTLTPSLTAELGADPGFVGTLASSFGLGAGAGYIVLSHVRLAVGIHRLGGVGLALMGVGTALAGLAPIPAAAVAGIALAGAGMTFSLNTFTTLIQADVPDLLRGRVMALWSMSFLGSRPITAFVTGWMTDAIGVRVAMSLSAITIFAGAWATRGARLLARPVATDGPGAPDAPQQDG
jgi:MFS family permease